ncbi:unnamed protein product [Coregonus sp. 'balchen']|nr:unnamed protein product [Coregonus sp. 'balchen']
MLVCTLDGDLYPPLEEPTGTVDPKKKKVKDKDKRFVWNHGITCPLKNTRKRRLKKMYIESPGVKKVKRLLRTDAEAPRMRPRRQKTKALWSTWTHHLGHQMGHGFSAKRDELREILNDISSSSDEDEGGLRREDEDLNIMDMEEDLVRQLQDKLNESSDGGRDEADRNNLIVMEYQVQVDCVKAKLKKTRAREKQQEDLIMKVENQALKNRFQALLSEIIHQEESEMEQEQLDSLIEM